MPTNFYMYFIVALIPMVVGFVYYHPKVLGNAWMKTNGFTEESLKGGNMALIFGLAYVFSLIIGLILTSLVIHQTAVFSIMMPEPGSDTATEFNNFMATYGNNFRTFGHGVLHGVTYSILFVGPILGTVALFERRSWKYVLIHLGYWAISLGLMGGVLCQTLKFAPLA